MVLDDTVADGHTQDGSLDCRFGRVERLEDQGYFFWAHAQTRVPDCYRYSFLFQPGAYRDYPAVPEEGVRCIV